MPDSGTAGAVKDPIDITQEVLLGAEAELPPAADGRRKRRLYLIIAAVVVLAGTATGLTLWLTGSSPATGLVITDQTVSVTTGTIQQTVAASGTIEPASQASLNFAVSGTVTAVNVKSGQTVTAGQVLATLGTTALQADVDAASAQLAAANDRLTSDEAASAATTTIDSDHASVTSAQSALSTAQTNLADASLTSTIAGTVASVSLTVGQQVSAGSNGAGGGGGAGSGSGSTAQIVVIGTDSYIVNTTVDDTVIGQVADGDQATITPTGASAVVYGTVASIGLIASQTSNVATFPVVINVTGNPGGLYAGSTAAVSIIVQQLNNVTEVPTAAISYNNGQAQVTQVMPDGSHVTRNVTVGAAQAGETQIVSGVKSGDKVINRVITFRGAPGGLGGGGIFGTPGGGGGGFPGGGGKGGGGFITRGGG